MAHTNTKYKALIFDFGGVLMDWDPRYLYSRFFADDPDAMEAFLLEIDFKGWNVEQDKGRPFAVAVEELSKQFPHHHELIKAYPENWQESIKGSIQATVDILAALKQAGYRLAGLSNWSAETFYQVRHSYEFFDWFETIILSAEVQLVKPDPAIYQLLLSKMNLTAQECIFIDDSLPNVEAADRLGITGIRFLSAEQLQAELERLGVLPAKTKSE